VIAMRVVRATAFGGPEVLVPSEASEPEPGPGELLVDVSVADVLFLDTQLRAGWGREFFELGPPFVPGAGVAGVVASVGDGVDRSWLGRSVIASSSGVGEYKGGGYAERAVVPADTALEVPDGLDLQDAIAALHDGSTALSRLERAQIESGDVVLVTAAGGSLGAWLVPLAARAGATVIAAARGERKLALARERGASVAVDYSEDDWAKRVRAVIGDAGVDVVFDGAGGRIGGEALELTGRGARFFAYGAASGEFAHLGAEAERRGVRVIGIDDRISVADRRRHAADALALLAAGEVRPLIGKVVPLERASEAHAAIEERSVAGKTLLVTGSRAKEAE
jgi:NADPH:quinone reductase